VRRPPGRHRSMPRGACIALHRVNRHRHPCGSAETVRVDQTRRRSAVCAMANTSQRRDVHGPVNHVWAWLTSFEAGLRRRRLLLQGCGEVFCSAACLERSVRDGHRLLCTGPCETDAHPLVQFKARHSASARACRNTAARTCAPRVLRGLARVARCCGRHAGFIGRSMHFKPTACSDLLRRLMRLTN
jgi:hypothetical protein